MFYVLKRSVSLVEKQDFSMNKIIPCLTILMTFYPKVCRTKWNKYCSNYYLLRNDEIVLDMTLPPSQQFFSYVGMGLPGLTQY